LVRARCAEDLLKAAIQRGTRQYVLVGAGMDTFVFRRPDLSKELMVFEIDHAESQAQKRQRLERAGLESPANVHFISADLERESVDQMLAGTSYSRDTPAFFAWLGVTPYLTRDANLRTLRSISGCAGEGSELVFDYVEQASLSAEQSSDDTGRFLAERQSSDEPFLSGFDPAQIGRDLAGTGFDLVDDLAPADAKARYCEGRADGLQLVAPGHIVHARVAPLPEAQAP
jgi:methyltransferase (TIGR00027 family)